MWLSVCRKIPPDFAAHLNLNFPARSQEPAGVKVNFYFLCGNQFIPHLTLSKPEEEEEEEEEEEKNGPPACPKERKKDRRKLRRDGRKKFDRVNKVPDPT